MTTITDPMRAKIRLLRGRLRLLFAADGAARVAAVTVAAVIAAVMLDWLLNLPGVVRLVLLLAAVALVGRVLLRRLVHPLRLGMNDEDLAVSVEARFPGLRDRLISTVEFTRGDEKSYFGSPAMVDAVIRETRDITDAMDFRERLATRGIARMIQTAALLTGAFVVALVFSAEARIGVQRLLMPLSGVRWPQRTFIDSVTPGDARIQEGTDQEVRVTFSRRLPSKAWIEYKTQGANAWLKRRMTAAEDGTFFTLFRSVGESFVYRVRGGDAESDRFRIDALERIRIWDKTLHYDYRKYTRKEAPPIKGAGGAIRAPVGTKVRLRATTNKPIAKMTVTLTGKVTTGFLKQTGPNVIEGELVLTRPGPKERPNYRITLTDHDGLVNVSEPFAISVEEDRPPAVRIEVPTSRDLSVTTGAVVPVQIISEDVYGLQDGALRYSITRGGETVDEDARELFKYPEYGETSDNSTLNWDLTELKLNVGDTVSYHGASRDFCDFPDADKPNVGTSEVFRLNVLSEEDYLDEMRRRQKRAVLRELEVAADMQDKNIKVSEDVAQKLGENKKLDDKDLARLLAVEMAQKQITQRAGRAAEAARTLRNDLVNNRLSESDVAKQLKTTSGKLDEMARGNLPQAESDINRARNAENDKKPKDLDKAVETQKSVKKDLDGMVRELRQWQSLAELRKRAERLLKNQQKLNNETLDVYKVVFGKTPNDEQKETLRNLGVVQRELKGELTSLLEDMMTTAAELAGRAPEQAKLLAFAQNEAKRVDVEKSMLDAATHLSAALLGRASDEQDLAEAGLKELVKNLSTAAEKDSARRDLQKKLAEIGKSLDKAITKEKNILDGTEGAAGLQKMLDRINQALRDVRGMKGAQAKTASNTDGAMGKPDETRKRDLQQLTRDQQKLEKDADKTAKDVGDIARDAPKVTPQGAKSALGDAKSSLGQASKSMGQASQSMQKAQSGQSGAGQKASGSQQQAQKKLGDAEKKLQEAKNAVKDAFERELARLKKEQERNKELADRIKHELEKLQKDKESKNLQNAQQNTGKASQSMGDAQSKMAQAGQQSQGGQGGGKQGKMDGAQEDEQKAVEDLQQARRDVDREQDEFEENDLAETLLEIETELKKMLTMQLGVNVATIQMDKVVVLDRDMTRKEERDLADATTNERLVSEKALEVKQTLEDERIPVFAWAVGDVAKDTNAIVARMTRKDTGIVTQKMQTTVVETLKDLIDALQRERRKREKKGGGGGVGGGGADRIVPPLAELKMIRTMHKRVSNETGDFDEIIRQKKIDVDDVKARVKELGDREKHIGKLLKDLLDALTEQQQ